ncbi:MAG: metallophosphoesterase [Abditibacteriota bacterium]|nr:metallophosphoesterase [Abditibacteriota bacterium]
MKKIFLLFFLTLITVISFCQEKTMVELNPDFEDHIISAKRTYNRRSFEYQKNTQALVLFHFSDVHGDKVELERYVAFLKHYEKYFDDAICTGDMVNGSAIEGFDFWEQVKGAEKILFIIGNHDYLRDHANWDWNDKLNSRELYDLYFSKYIKNWGVTYKEGDSYWYKDYDAKKVRLIGLNCALRKKEEEEQVRWFIDCLKGAKEKELNVLVAYHYDPYHCVQIECNFTDLNHYIDHSGGDDISAYQKAIEDFKAQGGSFICFIGGHLHWEQFAYNKDFPEQLFYNIEATNRQQSLEFGNVPRVDGRRSQDLANALVIDTTLNQLKLIRIGANETSSLIQRNGIVIDYKTFKIISQF